MNFNVNKHFFYIRKFVNPNFHYFIISYKYFKFLYFVNSCNFNLNLMYIQSVVLNSLNYFLVAMDVKKQRAGGDEY